MNKFKNYQYKNMESKVGIVLLAVISIVYAGEGKLSIPLYENFYNKMIFFWKQI